MGSFVPLVKTSEFVERKRKKVDVEGREILITKIEDKYYATDNRCPHLKGDLSLGKIEGTIITCPKHGSQFDLTDGHVERWLKGSGLISAVGKVLRSPRPLNTYNVKIEGDTIMVEI